MKKFLYILFLGPVCILSMLSIAYLFSREEPLFFLKNIKVNGLSQLGDQETMTKITPYLTQNIFKVDLAQVRESLSKHPFVKEVSIKRVYPFSLVIDVKEKKPSALWLQPDGAVLVLDEEGNSYRFLGKDDVKDLYLINTREKSDAKNVFNEINGLIAQGVLKRGQLSEAAYHKGDLTLFRLDDGVEIVLGREDHKTRLKRALAVLNDAGKRGLVIKCIDARFEKGAIIQEKKG
ncbi:MAG: cell division protein FtsQ/DivIB [Syntrophorhabdaceae bacterium]